MGKTKNILSGPRVITAFAANSVPPLPFRTRSYFCLWWKYIFPSWPCRGNDVWWRQKLRDNRSQISDHFLVSCQQCNLFFSNLLPIVSCLGDRFSLGPPVPCQKLDKWHKPMNTTSQKRFSLTRGLLMCAEFFLLCIFSSSVGMFSKWCICQNDMYSTDSS